MAIIGIGVLTRWSGTAKNEMAVALAYPGEWTDKGGQGQPDRTTVNLTGVFGKVDPSTALAINADPNFWIVYAAVWRAGDPPVTVRPLDGIPTPTEITNLGNFLSSLGVPPARVNILKTFASGKTRGQIAGAILAYAATLTK